MKRNSITIVEQHLEKIFLLVFLLAFVGVVSMQFLGGGATVRVRNQDLPLDRAYEELERFASQQLSKMESTDVDPSVPREIDDMSSEVLARFESPLGDPHGWSRIPLGFPAGDRSFDRVQFESHEVHEYQIPAPRLVRVDQHAGTLDPLVVSAYASELRGVVPSQQPFDVRMVSVGYAIDRDELHATLENANIPSDWYKGIEILDVEVERRLVDADEHTLVPPMPGRFSIRERLAADLDPREAQILGNRAKGDIESSQLVHPRPYRMISGVAWMPPTLDQESSDQHRIQQLLQKLRGVEQQVADVQRRLQQAKIDSAFNVYAQVGGGGRGGGGRDGGRDREQTRQQQEAQNLAERKAALETRLTKLQEDRNAIIGELGALGVQVQNGGVQIQMPEFDPGPARLSDLRADVLSGWANDMTVESGRVYQYRVRYVATNPLFSNEASLDDASISLASSAHVVSSWSSWSEPIAIDRDVYWIPTNTTGLEESSIGFVEPTCGIDVYRFFYGYWRKIPVRLHAGDSIATSLDIQSFGLPVFDLEAPDSPPSTIQDAMIVDTGAIVLDIRSMPGPDASRSRGANSVIIRDAHGAIASYTVGTRQNTTIHDRLEESFLSSSVASVLEPRGDVEPRPQTPQEPVEASSDESSSDGRGGVTSRDGRR
ncbi:MAG: hypothetical protein ACF8GE_07330 [Phycisphaerales bacterium JB043]